jgi:uncharacterized protein YbaR (Trm112 family)
VRFYLVYIRNVWGLSHGFCTVVLLYKVILDLLVCPLDDEIQNLILQDFKQMLLNPDPHIKDTGFGSTTKIKFRIRTHLPKLLRTQALHCILPVVLYLEVLPL